MQQGKRQLSDGDCVFDRGDSKHRKYDQPAIFEHTLKLLREGARLSSSCSFPFPSTSPTPRREALQFQKSGVLKCGKGVHFDGPQIREALLQAQDIGCDCAQESGGSVRREPVCSVCERQAGGVPCALCPRSICEACTRQCEACDGMFCPACSTTNFEERFDRTFCIDCNLEESIIRKANEKHSNVIEGNGVYRGTPCHQLGLNKAFFTSLSQKSCSRNSTLS